MRRRAGFARSSNVDRAQQGMPGHGQHPDLPVPRHQQFTTAAQAGIHRFAKQAAPILQVPWR